MILILAWTGFGLVATAQHHLTFSLSRGIELPWSRSLLLMMPVAMCWAVATPLILRLGQRFPISRTRWRTSLAVHLTACTGFILLLVVPYVLLSNLVIPPDTMVPLAERSAQVFVSWAVTDGVLYGMILTVGHMLEHRRRLSDREIHTVRLETELARAELQALKMQLQPHFLFNALHTIGALVRTGDQVRAVQVVSDLGDLLRRVVDDAVEQEVPLEQELELIRSYLAIEQTRFRDRLQVSIETDPETTGALVPHLILQPLVENAVRHGIARTPGSGRLVIRALRSNGQLTLSVEDDGAADSGDISSRKDGIGLSNTRARLVRLYGEASGLRLERADSGGHRAVVTLPFRPDTPVLHS